MTLVFELVPLQGIQQLNILYNGAHFARDSLILSTLVFPLEHLTVQKS